MIFPKKRVAAAGLLLVSCIGLASLPGLWPVAAQEPKPPFSSGEKLHYAVRWRLVPAGDAELDLGRDETTPNRWKATAKANSIGYVSNIYKVEDEYQSTFRNRTLCSGEIRKTINEGERHRELTIDFDQRRRLALLRDRDVDSNTPPRQSQSSIPDCVHDILSTLYYVRTQPLTVGQSFELPVNDGPRTFRLRVEVQAKEEVKTEAGTFQAIRIEPNVFSGNLFKEKGRMFVWFSDDANRLPVQLRVQIGIGTITASLVAVERADSTP